MKSMLIILFFTQLNFVKNEAVVIYEREFERNVINSVLLKNYEISYQSKYLPFIVVRFNEKRKDINEVIKELSNIKGVKKVTRNAILKPFAVPNDPLYYLQWHFKKIGMENAWDFGFGSQNVKVAVLDDGFAYRNGPIPSYESDEVISSDGRYHMAPDLENINVIATYDFIHGDSFPDPSSPHGTHVLGTIAQTTNNFYGVAGISPDVSLILVQVLGPTGGTASQIADGIAFAINKGAKVMNMSLGGPPGDSSGMTVLHLAIKEAYSKGALILCAAGNSGVSELSYPAGFKEAVAVGATDYNDSLTWYSQYGEGLEIVAPGGDLNVDANGDGNPDGVLQNTCYESGGKPIVDSFYFFLLQGTSMATPHVTGVVALCLSQDSMLTNLDLRIIITGTAFDLGEKGYDLRYGFGRIDAFKAVSFSAQSQYVVYPGDADANGVVDERDIIPIGLYFGITGPARNAGTNFEPQLAEKWLPRMATFADCNGDGIIDERDVLTVGKNFGLTYTSNYFTNSFYLNLPEIQEKKNNFYLIYNSTNNFKIKKLLTRILNLEVKKDETTPKFSIFDKKIKIKGYKYSIFDIAGRKIIQNTTLLQNKGIYFLIYKKGDKKIKIKKIILK